MFVSCDRHFCVTKYFHRASVRAGWSGLDFRQGQGMPLLFATPSRSVLGPTQPPIQWVPESLFTGGKAADAWSESLISI